MTAGVVGFLLAPREAGVSADASLPAEGRRLVTLSEASVLQVPNVDVILEARGGAKLLLLVAALPKMDGAEVTLLCRRLIDQDERGDLAMTAAVRLVLDQWLALDPEAVVGFVKKNRGPRVPPLGALLRQWQVIDASAAFAWAAANGQTGNGSPASLCRDRFRELVGSDRQAALQEASRLTEHQDVAYVAIVETWAKEEPEAAIRWASALTDPAVRKRVLLALLDTLAESDDMDRAIELAKKWDDPGLVDFGYYSKFMPEWIESDEAGVGAWFGSAVKDVESAKALLENRWVQSFGYGEDSHKDRRYPLFALSAMTAASHWLVGAEDMYVNQVRQMLGKAMRDVAREDPQSASKYLTRLAPQVLSASVISRYLEGWSTTEPEKALAFAEKLPNQYRRERTFARNFRSHSIHIVVEQWGESDPSAAAQYVDSKTEFYGTTVAKAWAKQDPQAALDWMATKSPEEQVALLKASISQIIPHDLETGLELIERLPAEDQRPHRRTAMHEWIGQSVEEASDYMRAFESDEDYQDPFGALARAWDEDNLPALGDYLKTLEAGKNRDAAVVALSQRLINRADPDFPLAFEWVEFIDDAELRVARSNWMDEIWRNKSPAAPTPTGKDRP